MLTMRLPNRPTTLFSTVLFIDGQPVGYQLISSGNTVRLMPDSLLAITGAPEIEATQVGNGWRLYPELDRNLADQVLEDLERFIAA
ncbi:MAG: hypothetical protein EOO08_02190 [Chitinophagaceae bacterium]|nr:MAG: hypothetical protein EOO08_02190 [Chitinophagaceae bacterium]